MKSKIILMVTILTLFFCYFVYAGTKENILTKRDVVSLCQYIQGMYTFCAISPIDCKDKVSIIESKRRKVKSGWLKETFKKVENNCYKICEDPSIYDYDKWFKHCIYVNWKLYGKDK